MIYYYSGASKTGDVQTDPSLSLGGKVSSSPIPNDLLQNIFSEASYLSIQQKKRETKLIVLHNDSTQLATNMTMTFVINNDTDESDSDPNAGDSLSAYRIAFVSPDDDGCFEQIINSAALPFNASFQDVINNDTISIPNLEADGYLGMWITRIYDFSSDDLSVKTCSYWAEQVDSPTIPGTEDELDIILDYELV